MCRKAVLMMLVVAGALSQTGCSLICSRTLVSRGDSSKWESKTFVSVLHVVPLWEHVRASVGESPESAEDK